AYGEINELRFGRQASCSSLIHAFSGIQLDQSTLRAPESAKAVSGTLVLEHRFFLFAVDPNSNRHGRVAMVDDKSFHHRNSARGTLPLLWRVSHNISVS